MQDSIALAIVRLAKLYFRLNMPGKILLWDRVCRPYLNWRAVRALWKTNFGARMTCSMEDFIQRKILFFGEWEPNLTAFLKRRLQPGDGFIDIGANVGYFSLLAAKSVGSAGFVLAIEASPSIFNDLQSNVRLNDFASNVRAVNIAVADREGELSIYKADASRLGETTTLAERGFQVEAQVRCAPLHNIATADELARVRMIKIDVEGAEVSLLQELADNIEIFRNDLEIVVELSWGDDDEASQAARLVAEAFVAKGFSMFELENDYSDLAYLRRSKPQPPVRLEHMPRKQVDVVLSRHAVNVL